MSKELDYITELERKNRLLGERCNQLLKDKGDLTDQIADIKANCDLAIEGRDVKIMELEQKLEQTEKDLADYQFNYPTIKELEKENADLKKRLEFARAEFQRQYKENTELRDNYDQFKAIAEPEIKRLKEENAELNDKLNNWVKCAELRLANWQKCEKENAELKEKYNRVDIIGYDALKNLTEAKERIRALLFHLTNDTFYVTFETQEQSVERARQFLRGIKE